MQMEKHPICDTDIWVDCSLLELSNVLFETSYNLYISDAVKFELESLKRRDKVKFGHAFDNYKKYKDEKKLFRIDLNNSLYFDNETHLAVRRKFLELKIPYCFIKEEYTNPKKNLGETVTVIFAGILELPVILSNDKETPNLALAHYNWLKVHNLKEMLIEQGKDINEINRIVNKLRSAKENDTARDNDLGNLLKSLEMKFMKN